MRLTCIVELNRPPAKLGVYAHTAAKLLNKNPSPDPVLPLQQQLHSLTQGVQLLLLPLQQPAGDLVPPRPVQLQPGLQAASQRRHLKALLLPQKVHVLVDLQENSISVQQPGCTGNITK